MDVERTGDKPDLPLWRNPAYLQDVANSLMGPSYAGMLWLGLEDHDRELFDRGVEQLREFVGFVKDIGFLVLPVCVLNTCADDQVRRAMEAAVASGQGESRQPAEMHGTQQGGVVMRCWMRSDVTPIVPMNPVSMGCAMGRAASRRAVMHPATRRIR